MVFSPAALCIFFSIAKAATEYSNQRIPKIASESCARDRQLNQQRHNRSARRSVSDTMTYR
jgi:hypothetical protein